MNREAVLRVEMVQRIWASSTPDDETGCWHWRRSLNHLGHGVIKIGGKKTSAQRAAWVAFMGEVPKGFCVFHKCDTPGCVNPEHLFLQRYGVHSKTHGLTRTVEYKTWRSMLARCRNPRKEEWKNYGGRGISVCQRWTESFTAFLEDMGPRPPGLTLDRIDVNGNYEPGNCRWANAKTQAENKRNSIRVVYNGEPMPIKQACALAGVKHPTAYGRIKNGKDWLTGAPSTLYR